MGQLLQFVITGIAVGSVYGLLALGFVIILNVTGVANFMQGTFVVLGGLIMVSLQQAHLPLLPALVVDAAIVAAVGLFVCAIVVLPFKDAHLQQLIVTLGLSIGFEGIALYVWSFNPLSYAPFSGSKALYFLGAAIYPQALWSIGAAILLVAVAYWFIEYTFVGTAVRACAMSRRAAQLIGIQVPLMAFIAFALSGAIGALLGAVITPLTAMTFNDGLNYMLNAFMAAVFGSTENPMAAVGGGVVLGIISVLTQGYVGQGWNYVAVLVLLLIVLIVRPRGLFANVFRARVAAA
ncbi:MAG: branched-chain amino acid ABC transporter permease [Chloroflexota bacterium]|nr:branched-chain amino acid ABC transporter permease [Chloroflexota bacterium]